MFRQRISARKLLHADIESLWRNLKGNFTVVFDDGEVDSNEKGIQFSHYIWEYHRQYPQTPLLMKHFLPKLLKSNTVNADAHISLLREAVFDTYDAYKDSVEDPHVFLDQLAELTYRIANKLYNELSYRLEEYVSSIDILDFLELACHPEIKKAVAEAPHNQAGIDQLYKFAKELMVSDPGLRDNNLVCCATSGIIKMPQVLQCCVVRGYLTDINSRIYPVPIMRGFVHGLVSLPDYAMESRSAAKALAFSEEPLQNAEFFSRRQQLICMKIERLHRGDCGSQSYLTWRVQDAVVIDGIKLSNCDLETIVGKYYLGDDGGLHVIKLTDKHLIGKTLKLRSVMAGCRHPDPYGICETCFGQLGETIPPETNIGHHCCVTEKELVVQNVLSTKHYDGSSVVEGIRLQSKARKYLWSRTNGSEYHINRSLKYKKLVLLVKTEQAPSLTDLEKVDDCGILNIERISSFETVHFIITWENGKTEEVELQLVLNKRCASMTHDFLAYVKQKGWRVGEDRNYRIDISDWTPEKAMFSLPIRHFNMADHQKAMEDFLEKEDPIKVSEGKSQSQLVREYHDLVNRKIPVNLAVLEVILLANLVTDAGNQAGLFKEGMQVAKGVLREIYETGSVSALMAFQGHKRALTSARQMIMTQRPDHIFDDLIMPFECSVWRSDRIVYA